MGELLAEIVGGVIQEFIGSVCLSIIAVIVSTPFVLVNAVFRQGGYFQNVIEGYVTVLDWCV